VRVSINMWKVLDGRTRSRGRVEGVIVMIMVISEERGNFV
jgi:hypothetical protein